MAGVLPQPGGLVAGGSRPAPGKDSSGGATAGSPRSWAAPRGLTSVASCCARRHHRRGRRGAALIPAEVHIQRSSAPHLAAGAAWPPPLGRRPRASRQPVSYRLHLKPRFLGRSSLGDGDLHWLTCQGHGSPIGPTVPSIHRVIRAATQRPDGQVQSKRRNGLQRESDVQQQHTSRRVPASLSQHPLQHFPYYRCVVVFLVSGTVDQSDVA